MWYKNRRYLHFDEPVSEPNALRVVSRPEQVAKHSFYPLLSYNIVTYKIKKTDSNGSLPKSEKSRGIKFPAHMDSHIYAFYACNLSRKYEERLAQLGLSDCVLAFRRLGKNNIHFANDAFNKIREIGDCGVVALDVSGFFDRIDHAILKDKWERLLSTSRLPPDHYAIFKSVTKYAEVDRNRLLDALSISKNNPKNGRRRICTPEQFRTNVRQAGLITKHNELYGIPQGTPISAFLSNLYLLDFDDAMHRAVVEQGGVYYRYCDDILLILPREFIDSAAGAAQQELKMLRLELNTDKTERRLFSYSGGILTSDKPLQYLGFLFDGQRITLRSAALSRYSQHMKDGVSLAKATCAKRNQLKRKRFEEEKPLFKKKIYLRYSHIGKRNFVTYGLNAAKIMKSEAIRKQVKRLWNRLQDELADENG